MKSITKNLPEGSPDVFGDLPDQNNDLLKSPRATQDIRRRILKKIMISIHKQAHRLNSACAHDVADQSANSVFQKIST